MGRFDERSERLAAKARFIRGYLTCPAVRETRRVRQRDRTVRPRQQKSRTCELAFARHALECFGRAFDAILAVIAIGGKQTDDFIGAARRRARHVTGREINGLSNAVLVLQRSAPSLETQTAALRNTGGRPDDWTLYSMRVHLLPDKGRMASTQILQSFQLDK
jgi:hypothetical protein